MKLTKLERHMAYMIMLAEFKYSKTGLCLVWYCITDEIRWHRDEFNLRYLLPELWQHSDNKEAKGADSWFSSDKKRLTALKQCIEETADAWPK